MLITRIKCPCLLLLWKNKDISSLFSTDHLPLTSSASGAMLLFGSHNMLTFCKTEAANSCYLLALIVSNPNVIENKLVKYSLKDTPDYHICTMM